MRGSSTRRSSLEKENSPYESTRLNCSCPCVASNRLLCRTTSVEGSCCTTTTTAGFVLQRERIRYRSLRDICNRDGRRGNQDKDVCRRRCRHYRKPRQPLRVGWRHGFHLLPPLEMARFQ